MKISKSLFVLLFLVAIFQYTMPTSAACVWTYCNDVNDSPSSRLLPRTAKRWSFSMWYYEYLPKQYAAEPTKKFPVIIHAHWVGEWWNGTWTDLAKVLINGVPKFIRMWHNMTFNVNGKEEAFIVLMPQAAWGWINPTHVEIMLEWAKANYRIDTSRVYMMWLSAWGSATWRYAWDSLTNASSLAAISPSCWAMNNYNGQSQTVVNNIAASNLPVWAYHWTGDKTISYDWSVSVVNSLNAYLPKPNPLAKITLYPWVWHNVWDKSMDPKNPTSTNVYQRFLQYTNQRWTVVIPTNLPPLANAWVDQTITAPTSSVILNGSLSKDSDGTIKTYTWKQVSGPSTSILSTPNGVTTTVSNLIVWRYEYELLLTDDKSSSAWDRVVITVNPATVVIPTNLPPVANAWLDQAVTLPSNTVTLNWSQSKDSDGSIALYSWRHVSWPNNSTIVTSSTVSTIIQNMIVGTYIYELKVTDNKWLTATDQVSVVVKNAVTATWTTVLPIWCSRILQANDNWWKWFYYDANTLWIKPWEVICIKPWSYSHFRIANLSWTAAQPITIKNVDWLVQLWTWFHFWLNFPNGRHFRVLGNWVPGIQYWIKVALKDWATSVAVGMWNSSDFELAHLEISKAWVAIMAKVNTSCDPMSWKENYIMKNVKLHDMYIHDIEGEWFYIWNTSMTETVTCDWVAITKEPAWYDGMEIYNIKMERTAWYGIQLARTKNARIYNNSITDRWRAKIDFHAAWILLWWFSNWYVFNNILTQWHSAWLQFYWVGKAYFYNNIINKAWQWTGQDWIYVADRPLSGAWYPLPQVHIFNNTIVSPNRLWVYVANQRWSYDWWSVIQNNVIVWHGWGWSGYSISVPTPVIKNNATYTSLNAAWLDLRFVPINSSLLVDWWVSISSYGVTKDYYWTNRLQWNNTDIWASESPFFRNNTVLTVNQSPIANAWVDQTIKLPVTTATLNWSLSKDPDGVIKTYSWKQISWPNTSTFSSTNTVQVTVSSLVVWKYTFELLVTDNVWSTAKDTIVVTVVSGTTTSTSNVAPTITMYGNQTVTLPFNSAAIYGVAKDSDGKIVSYEWKQVSWPTQATIEQATNFYTRVSGLSAWKYTFELTAIDNGWSMVKWTVIVTVAEKQQLVNQAPIANAGADQNITLPSNSITLDASQSKDNDGVIKSYIWKQISWPNTPMIVSPTTVSTSVINLVAWTYVFETTVMDDKWLNSSDSVTIIVKEIVTTNTKRRILVDLGSDTKLARSVTKSPDKNGNYWNSMNSFRANDSILLSDTTNISTSLSIKVINDLFANHPSSPIGINVVGDAVDVWDYPASAVRDNAFAWSATTVWQWQIWGLDTTKKYTIKFRWNRNATDNRTIQIKLSTDTNRLEYNAAKNTNYNNWAVFVVSWLSSALFDIRVKQWSEFWNLSIIDITEE